jgi:hypothetical protein
VKQFAETNYMIFAGGKWEWHSSNDYADMVKARGENERFQQFTSKKSMRTTGKKRYEKLQ